MKLKPSKTTNKLHFEDLDPRRFEDLCLNIIYRLKNWENIKHYGATGKDDGIDIYVSEKIDDNEIKWIVQCKRYKSINKSQLKDVIDTIKQVPDIFLLITACDISKNNQDFFENYAKENKIKKVEIWTQSILEAKLFSDYNDLLFIYFDIDQRKKINNNVQLINRKIKFRDLFKKELYNKFDPSQPGIGFHRFNCSKVIIQKIGYLNKEENVKDEFGWYKYFGGEPYNITDEGIILIIGLVSGYVKDNKFIQKNKINEKNNNIVFSDFYEIGLLSYDNILTYDFHSDEGRPIMYCKYTGKYGPFKKVYYENVDNYKYKQR